MRVTCISTVKALYATARSVYVVTFVAKPTDSSIISSMQYDAFKQETSTLLDNATNVYMTIRN